MSDLVERLRYEAPANGDQDRYDAAREIERLEARCADLERAFNALSEVAQDCGTRLVYAEDAAAKGENARHEIAGCMAENEALRARCAELEAQITEIPTLCRRYEARCAELESLLVKAKDTCSPWMADRIDTALAAKEKP